MIKFDLIFDKEMFKFAINGFIKNIRFAIDEIKIVFNKLFIFIITMNEHNDIFFLIHNKRRSSFIML